LFWSASVESTGFLYQFVEDACVGCGIVGIVWEGPKDIFKAQFFERLFKASRAVL
jgi:hypothetical protein